MLTQHLDLLSSRYLNQETAFGKGSLSDFPYAYGVGGTAYEAPLLGHYVKR